MPRSTTGSFTPKPRSKLSTASKESSTSPHRVPITSLAFDKTAAPSPLRPITAVRSSLAPGGSESPKSPSSSPRSSMPITWFCPWSSSPWDASRLRSIPRCPIESRKSFSSSLSRHATASARASASASGRALPICSTPACQNSRYLPFCGRS
ncbi:hypothetical protein BMS3Abin16_01088 [archaeon BMS3Abin16]|nr:hypothetical protein BMS3Abin16_01088 [archaeon BMS3Abin16]